MRLIDADTFFDNLDCYSDTNKIQKMLDRQPIAYNVDAVVDEIDRFKNKFKDAHSDFCKERGRLGQCGNCTECIIKEIKSIVRKGGV